jgi:hypothetical protein
MSFAGLARQTIERKAQYEAKTSGMKHEVYASHSTVWAREWILRLVMCLQRGTVRGASNQQWGTELYLSLHCMACASLLVLAMHLRSPTNLHSPLVGFLH